VSDGSYEQFIQRDGENERQEARRQRGADLRAEYPVTEYIFDVKLTGTVRVEADSEADARKMLGEAIECADTNFGAWPNGDPILGEVSLACGDPVLAADVMARDSAGCECKGWCGCHKPGWPAGETCDCKPELDLEDVA
jgi:hypothetical protein